MESVDITRAGGVGGGGYFSRNIEPGVGGHVFSYIRHMHGNVMRHHIFPFHVFFTTNQNAVYKLRHTPNKKKGPHRTPGGK